MIDSQDVEIMMLKLAKKSRRGSNLTTLLLQHRVLQFVIEIRPLNFRGVLLNGLVSVGGIREG